jgi:hypothetical protein
MNIETLIKKKQETFGFKELQDLIENGMAWKMEGSVGRSAMDALTSGACFLPLKTFYDYYGNPVPSRDKLEDGTKGTLLNSQRFWDQH